MELAHFYHAYADGNWKTAADEHLSAIAPIPFTHRCLGVVGTPRHRAEVSAYFPGWEVVVEADTGYEDLTLNRLRAFAQDAEGKVLYAHTKGAGTSYWFNDLWRQRMTEGVAGQWQRCVTLLDSHDAVGSYWLTPQEWGAGVVGPIPLFAGNFWWATTAYLRKLPEIAPISRYEAEVWVGKNNPKIFCLLAGWPGV